MLKSVAAENPPGFELWYDLVAPDEPVCLSEVAQCQRQKRSHQPQSTGKATRSSWLPPHAPTLPIAFGLNCLCPVFYTETLKKRDDTFLKRYERLLASKTTGQAASGDLECKRGYLLVFQDHSEEDETLSLSSSDPPESVQSPNASVHSSADREHTKESTQHAEDQTDHTGDSPPWHPSGRTPAPDTEQVEEAREEKQKADRDEDACQHRTLFTRELVLKGNTHEEEPKREWDERLEDEEDEDEEKHTHMESEARAQDNTDASRYVARLNPGYLHTLEA